MESDPPGPVVPAFNSAVALINLQDYFMLQATVVVSLCLCLQNELDDSALFEYLSRQCGCRARAQHDIASLKMSQVPA